jgi:hypothetical protein
MRRGLRALNGCGITMLLLWLVAGGLMLWVSR